jgi:hypothetical protein
MDAAISISLPAGGVGLHRSAGAEAAQFAAAGLQPRVLCLGRSHLRVADVAQHFFGVVIAPAGNVFC